MGLGRRIARTRVLALVAAVWLLVSSSARASPRRLALLGGGDELRRAVEVVLASWGVQVLAPPDWPAPRARVPVSDAAADARALAAAHGVDGVVWITRGDDASDAGAAGHAGEGADATLWVFDARTEQLITRPLGVTALGESASAAAVALTLKTVLRSSTVAPPREQIGAAPARPPWLRIEADGAFRSFADGSSSVEPRLALGASVWPRALDGRVGVAAGLGVGPGASIESRDLTGRIGDLTVGSSLRARLRAGAVAVLEPSLGASLHVSSLDGAVAQPALAVHTRRTDASADLALAASLALGESVELGLRAAASYLLRHPRYLVEGRAVLESTPLLLEVGVRLGVALF